MEDFNSSAIQAKTVARKSVGLVTFPPYLLLQLQKFTTDSSWQPVKLDCSVDMPATLDLESLRWDTEGEGAGQGTLGVW